ncbi:MAG: LLM class flavin-dependent oxidoreductase [Nitrososphaerales archaeon]
MKFGLRMCDWFGSVENMVRLGVLAEKNGFDSVWVSHDIFMRSSMVTLTIIGAQTKKVYLGNTILNPYTTNPAEIAMYLSALDEYTKGRALCGLSAGALEYLRWLGIEHERPLTRVKETVEVLRKLWAGENAAYNGKEIKWSSECYMRFDQYKKKIPIYIGGQGEKLLAYSGAYGDGVLPILYPPEFIDIAMERMKAGAREVGRDFSEVDVAGCVWLSISKKGEVAEEPLRKLVAYFGPMLGELGLSTIGLSHKDFEPIQEVWRKEGLDAAAKLVTDKMLNLAIRGTPDDCIAKIEMLQKKGLQHISIGAPLGPDPEESVKLLGKYVIPYFREMEK